MKGVVLAGGSGTRLFPLTKITNKHLLPVWDKPMIYYPLECLAKAGIEEVLLVTGGNNAGDFIRLLGRGAEVGIKSLQYTYQDGSGGIAQALGLAQDFAAGGPICLILGDNIIQRNIREPLRRFRHQGEGARVLLTPVDHPEQYGVAEIDGDRIVRIVEKPKQPPSNLAVIGIYFYDGHVFDIVRSLRPSARGELEITDVNNAYLARGQLTFDVLEGWWADAGENIEYYYQACLRVRAEGANQD
ncbi:MAG TPA: sugar phosphate nucleotidyltransferase [Phycisphaerae bacterium]|nr:sugar phosphate nucleotidyltransferase [Phycisphaerae bacterium]HNU47040.1 sugar phosphate nucleotidyltransferase [Phycisphaerae bacterium]